MGLYDLPRGAGSAAAWPAGGLSEAGDSARGGVSPGGQPRIAQEAGGHRAGLGQVPGDLGLHGRPSSICVHVVPPKQRVPCGRQCLPSSAEGPRVVI